MFYIIGFILKIKQMYGKMIQIFIKIIDTNLIYANHEKLISFYKTPACIAIIRYPSYSFVFSLFFELRQIIFCVSLSFFNIPSFYYFMLSFRVSFFIDFIRPTISVFTFMSFYISYSCSFIIDSILPTFSLLFTTFL